MSSGRLATKSKGGVPNTSGASASTGRSSGRPSGRASQDGPSPSKKPYAVQFGPGNISRGLIAPILKEAGYHIVFASRSSSSPTWGNGGGSYTIDEYGPGDPVKHQNDTPGKSRSPGASLRAAPSKKTGSSTIEPKDYTWITYQDKAEAHKYAKDASIITCATTGAGYDVIGQVIAAALEARTCSNQLTVVACENEQNATDKLRREVENALRASLNAQEVNRIMGKAVFSNAVIDRIVPKPTDPCTMPVEASRDWIMQNTVPLGTQDAFRNVQGVRFVDDVDAWFARKKLTVNTAHAVTAYYGHLYKVEYIHDAIMKSDIRLVVEGVLGETSIYLFDEYPGMFDRDEHKRYTQSVVHRFENAFLKDTIKRVAKDPMKKLGSTERLLTPAIALEARGIPTKNLHAAISAALRYQTVDDDRASAKLGTRMTIGSSNVVEEVMGIRPEDPVYATLLKIVGGAAEASRTPRRVEIAERRLKEEASKAHIGLKRNSSQGMMVATTSSQALDSSNGSGPRRNGGKVGGSIARKSSRATISEERTPAKETLRAFSPESSQLARGTNSEIGEATTSFNRASPRPRGVSGTPTGQIKELTNRSDPASPRPRGASGTPTGQIKELTNRSDPASPRPRRASGTPAGAEISAATRTPSVSSRQSSESPPPPRRGCFPCMSGQSKQSRGKPSGSRP